MTSSMKLCALIAASAFVLALPARAVDSPSPMADKPKAETAAPKTTIQALGSRQVGQVICVIENPDRDLLPGTNVTAEIRAESIQNALTIPREAIRRELGHAGVFVLAGDHVEWKKITIGIGNTTRAQIEGIKEGDSVALPTEKPLKEGMVVKALY